jgi:ribosomal protein S27E
MSIIIHKGKGKFSGLESTACGILTRSYTDYSRKVTCKSCLRVIKSEENKK